MPLSVVGLFACWQGRFGRHRNGDIWKVVPLCLMWCIWKERNSKCFEDIERSMPDLKLLFLRTLFDWFSVWRNQPFSSILDLLDFCNIRFWFVHPCILPVYLGVSLFWHQWILITYQKKIIASQRDNNALKDKNEKPNLLIQNLGLEINHYRIHPQWQEHS